MSKPAFCFALPRILLTKPVGNVEPRALDLWRSFFQLVNPGVQCTLVCNLTDPCILVSTT